MLDQPPIRLNWLPRPTDSCVQELNRGVGVRPRDVRLPPWQQLDCALENVSWVDTQPIANETDFIAEVRNRDWSRNWPAAVGASRRLPSVGRGALLRTTSTRVI